MKSNVTKAINIIYTVICITIIISAIIDAIFLFPLFNLASLQASPHAAQRGITDVAFIVLINQIFGEGAYFKIILYDSIVFTIFLSIKVLMKRCFRNVLVN